jgi:DNA-binding response OmpR family regulator
MRALVIDDDVNVGVAIQVILASQQFESELALRAHSGIQAFEQRDFDIVIVDLFLPGISGIDTIRQIRQRAPNVPILAMTGFRYRLAPGSMTDLLDFAGRHGANSSVRKPFTPDQLIDAIARALGPRS